jgi:hypothetical protein
MTINVTVTILLLLIDYNPERLKKIYEVNLKVLD